MNRLPLPPVEFKRVNKFLRRRPSWRLYAAAAGVLPTLSASAQITNATWIGLGGSTSWSIPANWDTNISPDGVGAFAHFAGGSGGPIVQLGGSTITLSGLDLSDPLFSAVVGGTINLVGSAIVNASGSNFDLPDKVFPNFGSANPNSPSPGNSIGGVGSLTATFIGTNGLNKTGDSHLQIDSPQFYSGTTSITGGGKIITTIGDSAFGDVNNGIDLNGGSIQVALTNWTSNRTINIGSLGGAIYWVDSGRSVDLSGNISGSGPLTINGRYGVFVGPGTFRANNTYSGTLTVGGGNVTMKDNGAFANAVGIISSGSIVLDNTNSATSINRIGDASPLVMRGSSLALKASTVNYTENIGTVNLDGGVSFVTLEPGSGGVRLNATNFVRNSHAGLVVRGTNLGLTPGSGNSNFFFTGGQSLLVDGLLPFAYVNPSYTSASTPEDPNNVLASYDVNKGITAITSYNSTFAAGGNVKISANQTVSGDQFINALVLAAPANLQVAAGQAGITVGSSAGYLYVDSGVVLSANAGFQTAGSGSIINSLPGNQINSQLDFGAREGYLLTPSALTINGSIHGTGGLTKLGARTALFLANSDYTGVTTLTGFNRFRGDVLANGLPSVFGESLTPINLYGGNVDPYNPNSGTINGTGMGELGYENTGSALFARQLNISGDWVQLRDFGTGTINWGGNISSNDDKTLLMFLTSKATAHQVVSGTISGKARVVIGAADPNPSTPGDPEETWVDLRGTNSFTGGLVISGGTVAMGNENALGTGSVQLNGDGAITALSSFVGGSTVSNKIVVYSSKFGVASDGGATIIFGGEINGRGGNYIANITGTATTTFAGSMTGGGLFKQGMGTLVVSGNNTFTGQFTVGNGTIAGGAVILKSSNALGSTAGATAVEVGQNALILDGSPLPIPGSDGFHDNDLTFGQELLFLRGDGLIVPGYADGGGALVSVAGNNVWNGTVQPLPKYAGEGTANPTVSNARVSIRVDAGSTLTLNGGLLADDPGVLNNSGTTLYLATGTNSLGIRKLGSGSLIVGSHVIATKDAQGNVHNWNAAIRTSGTLDIEGGVVSIASNSGVGTLSGGKSVVHIGGIKFGGNAQNPVGQLDLNDNAIVIDYTGASPLATIQSYLHAGFNNGSWNGSGIVSDRVASSPNDGEEGRTGLVLDEATNLGITTYLGDPIDSTSLILRYAYLGDCDLDGDVDAHDLGLLARSWQQSGSWQNGDFNYDGKVDLLDMMLFAPNWQVGVDNPLNAAALGLDLASFGLPQIPLQVPEPAISGLLGVLGASWLARRNRKSAGTAPFYASLASKPLKLTQFSAVLTDPKAQGHKF
ncbi:MAG TPA: autotransporter-associated beta strand repeat-containing protein [Tepidisphaeraceae bacterium]|nr:autotransporter-associated beta strand repeat-containing protein [Tepidisphaeraceae bacterium]